MTLPASVTLRLTEGNRNETKLHRLDHHGHLFRLRARSRFRAETLHEDQHGFLSLGPFDSGLDHGPRLHFGESGRPGSDWHGSVRREVRHRHEPLLLDRSDSRHGFHWRLYDAFLLRFARALGTGVPEAAFR